MSKLSKDYLTYTFLIMTVSWGICVIFSINGITLSNNYLLYIPFLLGGFSPTIASFIVLKKNNNVKSFKEWLKNIFDFKNNLISYLMVILFGIIYIMPQVIISGYDSGAPLYAIVFMIPMMIFGGGLEEAGWRYILQPELEKKYNFILSTIIVSMIWWLWHLPLFFIRGVGQYGTNYLAFGISVVGLSFALATIKRNTNSVWLCVLFHCIVNSISGIYIIKANISGNIVSSIILIVVSYILIKANEKKYLDRVHNNKIMGN